MIFWCDFDLSEKGRTTSFDTTAPCAYSIFCLEASSRTKSVRIPISLLFALAAAAASLCFAASAPLPCVW